jgi:4-amino-4-deoxy-L-arabinose transferase-like glycosyltransferase
MIHLLAPLVAAGAVYSLARSAGRGPALVAAGTVLHLPMVAGITRHFMPEGLLVATVALAIAAAQRHRNQPAPASAALLGLALALAFLTKQTAVLFLFPVVLLVRPHRSLLWALPTAALALPWTLTNLGDQLLYLAGSAGLGTDRGWGAHLLFYPRSLWAPALGPIWIVLVAVAGALAWRTRHRRLVLLGLAWLGGSMLLLTLVPRKYDRMLAPALPGAALILAAGVAARPRLAWLSLVGAGWTTWLSWDTSLGAPSAANTAFQTGCPQVWLRPPQGSDPGFDPIVAALQAGEQERVVVLQGPEIPCAIQTTFGWTSHLGPYLRRSGVDRELAQDEQPQPGDLVVDFDPNASGPAHPVPLLGVQYRIRTP